VTGGILSFFIAPIAFIGVVVFRMDTATLCYSIIICVTYSMTEVELVLAVDDLSTDVNNTADLSLLTFIISVPFSFDHASFGIIKRNYAFLLTSMK